MIYPYIPHTDEDRKVMLEAIGLSSMEELFFRFVRGYPPL